MSGETVIATYSRICATMSHLWRCSPTLDALLRGLLWKNGLHAAAAASAPAPAAAPAAAATVAAALVDMSSTSSL